MKPKTPQDFTKISDLTQQEGGGFQHQVKKVTKKAPDKTEPQALATKYKNLWYMKEFDSKYNGRAISEIIAQEFLRLLSPSQPKTRLIKSQDGKYFILSKGIPNAISLESLNKVDTNINIKTGKYSGFGRITVAAVYFKEIDLRSPNVVVDSLGNIIKLDGDWSFAHFESPYSAYNFKITHQLIQSLPILPADYYVYNWFDAIMEELRTASPILAAPTLNDNQYVRKEINETLLQILILPNNLIRDFVNAYGLSKDESQRYYNELIKNKHALFNAAKNNIDFQKYILSMEYEEHLNDYVNYLIRFKTTGKDFLVKDLKKLDKDIQTNLSILKREIQSASVEELPLPNEKKTPSAIIETESHTLDEFGRFENATSPLEVQKTPPLIKLVDEPAPVVNKNEVLSEDENDEFIDVSLDDPVQKSPITENKVDTQEMNDLTSEALQSAALEYSKQISLLGPKNLVSEKTFKEIHDKLRGFVRDNEGVIIKRKTLTNHERYVIAIDFISQNPNHRFSKELTTVMGLNTVEPTQGLVTQLGK